MRIGMIERSGDAVGYAGRIKAEILRQRPDARCEQDPTNADIVLVVIGGRWARANPGAASLLLASDDAVRLGIESAVAAGRQLVPVLVSGASFPSAADLPQSLAGLLQINAHTVSHAGFRDDVKHLLDGLLRPARSVAPATGTIILETPSGGLARRYMETEHPMVRITIDGEDRGAIWLLNARQVLEVKAGEHSVTLEASKRPRFRCTVQVRVRAGESVKLQAARHWLTGIISLQAMQ